MTTRMQTEGWLSELIDEFGEDWVLEELEPLLEGETHIEASVLLTSPVLPQVLPHIQEEAA